MQCERRAAAAADAAVRFVGPQLPGRRPDFEYFHAGIEQRCPISPVRAVHYWNIGRSQRIGQDADAHSALAQVFKRGQACGSRDEIRRDDDQFPRDAVHVTVEFTRRRRNGITIASRSGLFRRIGHDDRIGPGERRASPKHSCQRLSFVEATCDIVPVRPFAIFLEHGPCLGFGRLSGAGRNGLLGNRQCAIPVGVETFGQLGHDCTDRGDVEVSKANREIAGFEIGVRHVPAPDDGNRAIDHHQLIVHPVIDARCTERELDLSEQRNVAPVDERIEQADFDILVLVQRRQRRSHGRLPDRIEVVDQQANVHVAVGGAQHGIQQELARVILDKDEILDVERSLGRSDKLRSHQ